MFDEFVRFVRDLYCTNGLIPLHEPKFIGNEKQYLLDAIDSTFVSSVGPLVGQFENRVAEYTGANYAIATVNGTAALHIALKLAGVVDNSEVITQSLTFVATCNAIRYCGARPVFVDVDRSSLGLSGNSLVAFLEEYAEIRDDGYCWNIKSNRKIVACLPMHTFGFPVDLDAIRQVCDKYNIVLVEDAAESLGSLYKKKQTGIIGKISAISFNGNKIITTGGGGMILTNDKNLAKRAKHITTTAKVPHQWKFGHDEVAYNYRLPNLNAALGIAQMESLSKFLDNKRETAHAYQEWGKIKGLMFVKEPDNTTANYWLNTVLTENRQQRDDMLQQTNSMNVMTRPAWEPMHLLGINQDCQTNRLPNTEYLYDRLVNVPSGVRV